MGNDHYTYRVTWSREDGEHVRLCSEFPLLRWLVSTAEEAFAEIRRLVNEVVTEMREAGERHPASLTQHA